MRVGGNELIDVDFRLIAATNRDLEREVDESRFREDLYYRLKVVSLRIPPLRERLADLPVLAEHFLRAFAEREHKEAMQLSKEALAILSSYSWPGNVRELRNVIESVAVFHPGGEIRAEDLPTDFRRTAAPSHLAAPVQVLAGTPKTMAEIERQAILETLERTEGRRSDAARLLGIGLRTLQRKLKEYRDQGFYNE
jgi:DNA-binding NtrC family response regulator